MATMASPGPRQTIDSLLRTGTTFDPPPNFRERAWGKGDEMHRRPERDPEVFWADMAREFVTFRRPCSKVLEWNPPHAKWFVGAPHPAKGQAIFADVVLKAGQEKSDALRDALKVHVRKEIGALAAPEQVYLVDSLPKTRSGKIMRRVMRAVANGEEIGDVTTLEDESAVDEVRAWLATVGKG